MTACSIRSSITSPVKSLTSPGLCLSTTSCTPCSRLLSSESSISLCQREFWIGTHSFTFLDSKTLSSRGGRSGCGSEMHCITALYVQGFCQQELFLMIVQILFGFSIILFWGDLKQTHGYDSGHWFWGTTLYLAVLLTVLGKAALVSKCVSVF